MKEYVVTISGLPHTVLLDEAEAKRLRAEPVATKSKAVPNKSRATTTKAKD